MCHPILFSNIPKNPDNPEKIHESKGGGILPLYRDLDIHDANDKRPMNDLRVHPPIKLKSKLLIRSSPNFTHIKMVSMRPPILNFRSISQFWQP